MSIETYEAICVQNEVDKAIKKGIIFIEEETSWINIWLQ